MANGVEQGPQDGGNKVNLATLWGDFREFRGEMRSRMDTFGSQLSNSMTEVREAADRNHVMEAKLHELEQADLARRVHLLEGNWRLAAWVGAAVGLLTLGLFADLVRTWLLGVGG